MLRLVVLIAFVATGVYAFRPMLLRRRVSNGVNLKMTPADFSSPVFSTLLTALEEAKVLVDRAESEFEQARHRVFELLLL